MDLPEENQSSQPESNPPDSRKPLSPDTASILPSISSLDITYSGSPSTDQTLSLPSTSTERTPLPSTSLDSALNLQPSANDEPKQTSSTSTLSLDQSLSGPSTPPNRTPQPSSSMDFDLPSFYINETASPSVLSLTPDRILSNSSLGASRSETTQPSTSTGKASTPQEKRKSRKRRKRMSSRICKYLHTPNTSRHYCRLHPPSTSEDDDYTSSGEDW